MIMLADQELRAFVPTVKRDEARTFYRDILGLELISEDNFALEFNANGTILRVNMVREFKPQEFTVLGWHVNDLASAIEELNRKGISCEKYDFLQQDHLGIWTSPGGPKVAWFKDPDGNILSLTGI
jgi:catechol 2,3-dioxygenase-like lactoylglutathione lyase family enzyme